MPAVPAAGFFVAHSANPGASHIASPSRGHSLTTTRAANDCLVSLRYWFSSRSSSQS
jgi:hypothetical protein